MRSMQAFKIPSENKLAIFSWHCTLQSLGAELHHQTLRLLLRLALALDQGNRASLEDSACSDSVVVLYFVIPGGRTSPTGSAMIRGFLKHDKCMRQQATQFVWDIATFTYSEARDRYFRLAYSMLEILKARSRPAASLFKTRSTILARRCVSG